MNDQMTLNEARDIRQPESEGRVVLHSVVRRRVFVCCFCGTVRPSNWRKHGWGGVWVQIKGQKSHWCCAKCKPEWDVGIHAREVADGMCKCEPPNSIIDRISFEPSGIPSGSLNEIKTTVKYFMRPKIIGMVLALLMTSGCMTGKLNKIVTALGKDPATVHVRVTTIYGAIEFSRTNPSTNTLPHTVSPDGTITVSEHK